ncbi:M20 metallopeptidase family protein [Intestinibacter bartlettii]|uniref:Amidohydrolase n=1 Tax=Intestinibacter bartlettii TaxID=261299 RepID=A0ABS6DW41_9FIRM|nr:M20 family metallopeptidase [Intestinibacter bartlettii]MBU5336024.1 amidohydrolase [Intestinibacter bartlettii]MDO5010093.1 M20 family metallopeptidase [Intestinibacter bartlettii]
MFIDSEDIKKVIPDVIKIRRHIHMYPEISEQEYETSKFIKKCLEEIGLEANIIGDTGVVSILMNNPEFPTVGLRAEMDALPIEEETNLEFKSKKDGVMHACSHDGIVATALGVAKLLYQHKDELKCNVKFIFEPAEEVGKGAKKLIKEKVLENPKVDKMVIFHYANSEPIGMEIQKGVSTATLGRVGIEIIGKSSHWCEPEKGINAISVSAKVINAIDKINEDLKEKMQFVLGMGMINGGIKNNIIAENVKLEGTLRTFCEENFEYVLTYLQDRMKEIEEETKATIKVTLISHLPALINNPDLVEMGSKVGKEVFGDRFVLGEKPFLAGDNAAYYFRLVPGVRMVFFAEKENQENWPLHNGKFDFNEDIFPYAVSTLYNLISDMK